MSSFHNRKRATQLVDFAGLQYGKTRPTDIDMSIDWQKKTFVLTEIKGKYQKLTVGQRIHLEGLVDAIRAGGRVAYALFAKHDTRAHEDVQAIDCFDVMVYDGEGWTTTCKTLGDTMESLYQEHLERQAA